MMDRLGLASVGCRPARGAGPLANAITGASTPSIRRLEFMADCNIVSSWSRQRCAKTGSMGPKVPALGAVAAHPVWTSTWPCDQHQGHAFRGPSGGWRLQPHPRRRTFLKPAGDQDRSGGSDIRQILIIATHQCHRGSQRASPAWLAGWRPSTTRSDLTIRAKPVRVQAFACNAPQLTFRGPNPASKRQFAQQEINSRRAPSRQTGRRCTALNLLRLADSH